MPNRPPSEFAVTLLTPWFPDTPGAREGNYVYESARTVAKLGRSVDVLVSRPYTLPGLAASTSSARLHTERLIHSATWRASWRSPTYACCRRARRRSASPASGGMASGLLPVGARGHSPSAFIEHGVTGLLVEAGDTDRLVAQLEAMLRDPTVFCTMAEQGEQIAHREYAWQAHARRHTEVFREALGSPQ